MADRLDPATSRLLAQLSRVPAQPGLYLFKDARGTILYIGKAANLRDRVHSYFRQPRSVPAPRPDLPPRIAKLLGRVADIELRPTASESEALLLESELIKVHQPRYNVAFRDDKTYPLLKLTAEPFPRLLVTRARKPDGSRYFGPYPDAGLMHEAVRFLRRVFPLRTCRAFPKAPCLEYHLGQCLAPCVDYINKAAYDRIVSDLVAFLEGKRERLLRELAARMRQAARDQRFEEAARLRDQIDALTSVVAAKDKSAVAGPLEQLQLALKLPALPKRIEAFDISNLFGTHAVGSMVTFADARPLRAHYRTFKIATVEGSNDVGMMREVIRRRYGGTLAPQLPWPDLIVVDGGVGQVGAAVAALEALARPLPVIGLAKRLEHIIVPGQADPVVLLSTSPVLHLLQHLRDEAHRVAVTYHRRLRARPVRASALDAVPGIGPNRKAALLTRFGSVARLRRARPEEIAAVGRLGLEAARRLLRTIQEGQ